MGPRIAKVVLILERARPGLLRVQQFEEHDAESRLVAHLLPRAIGADYDAGFPEPVHTPDPIEVAVLPAEGRLEDPVQFRDGDGLRHQEPAPDLGFGVLDADTEVEGVNGGGGIHAGYPARVPPPGSGVARLPHPRTRQIPGVGRRVRFTGQVPGVPGLGGPHHGGVAAAVPADGAELSGNGDEHGSGKQGDQDFH